MGIESMLIREDEQSAHGNSDRQFPGWVNIYYEMRASGDLKPLPRGRLNFYRV